MKFFIFLFLIFLILISVNSVAVLGSGFSPSSLVFELGLDEEECKTVYLTSDSELITVRDKWAENPDVDWKISLFETGSEDLGLSIDYQDELSLSERAVEVCLSGARDGEYHGVLLMREAAEGNTAIQMGVWLKAMIGDPSKQTFVESSGSGDGSAGGDSEVDEVDGEQDTEGSDEEIKESDQESKKDEKFGVTGYVVAQDSKIDFKTVVIIIMGLVIIALLIVFFMYRK